MKQCFLKVRLIQEGHSVSLNIPNLSDRVFEIVTDAMVSDATVSFECIFEKDF